MSVTAVPDFSPNQYYYFRNLGMRRVYKGLGNPKYKVLFDAALYNENTGGGAPALNRIYKTQVDSNNNKGRSMWHQMIQVIRSMYETQLKQEKRYLYSKFDKKFVDECIENGRYNELFALGSEGEIQSIKDKLEDLQIRFKQENLIKQRNNIYAAYKNNNLTEQQKVNQLQQIDAAWQQLHSKGKKQSSTTIPLLKKIIQEQQGTNLTKAQRDGIAQICTQKIFSAIWKTLEVYGIQENVFDNTSLSKTLQTAILASFTSGMIQSRDASGYLDIEKSKLTAFDSPQMSSLILWLKQLASADEYEKTYAEEQLEKYANSLIDTTKKDNLRFIKLAGVNMTLQKFGQEVLIPEFKAYKAEQGFKRTTKVQKRDFIKEKVKALIEQYNQLKGAEEELNALLTEILITGHKVKIDEGILKSVTDKGITIHSVQAQKPYAIAQTIAQMLVTNNTVAKNIYMGSKHVKIDSSSLIFQTNKEKQSKQVFKQYNKMQTLYDDFNNMMQSLTKGYAHFKENSTKYTETVTEMSKQLSKASKSLSPLTIINTNTKNYNFIQEAGKKVQKGFSGGTEYAINDYLIKLNQFANAADLQGIPVDNMIFAIKHSKEMGMFQGRLSQFQNFLGLIAASLMFESTDLLMQQALNKQFNSQVSKNINSINVFVLNGTTVPLSYMYKDLLNNLSRTLRDSNRNLQGSVGVKINNVPDGAKLYQKNQEMLKNPKLAEDHAQRWRIIGEMANEKAMTVQVIIMENFVDYITNLYSNF